MNMIDMLIASATETAQLTYPSPLRTVALGLIEEIRAGNYPSDASVEIFHLVASEHDYGLDPVADNAEFLVYTMHCLLDEVMLPI